MVFRRPKHRRKEPSSIMSVQERRSGAHGRAGGADMMNVAVLLQRALAYQRSGNLAEAERLCMAILAAQSDHFDALHLSGLMAAQRGRFEAAHKLLSWALEINPKSA